MTEKKIPFVGLHAHSVAGSIFDAIGYPDEHMDFCYENGGEALSPHRPREHEWVLTPVLTLAKDEGRRERSLSLSLV